MVRGVIMETLNFSGYDKYIFHIDVNSAFLSWSALKKLKDEPGSIDLRTVPSAVGGDVQKRHGIITAKSIANCVLSLSLFSIDYSKETFSFFRYSRAETAFSLLKQNWSFKRSGNSRLIHILSDCSLPIGP